MLEIQTDRSDRIWVQFMMREERKLRLEDARYMLSWLHN